MLDLSEIGLLVTGAYLNYFVSDANGKIGSFLPAVFTIHREEL
jgi:hypothetical protein